MRYIEIVLGTLFNPVLVLTFVILGTTQPFADFMTTKVGTNTYKFNFLHYLLFGAIACGTLWVFLQLHNSFSTKSLDLFELFQWKTKWLIITSFVLSGLVLMSMFTQGVEWNVFGFIFFPLLLLAILLFIIHFARLPFSFAMDKLPSWGLATWQSLIIHAFNPFLVAVFLSHEFKNKDISFFEATLTLLITNALIYAFWFGAHWLVFLVKKTNLGIGDFFNNEGTLIYYLPFFLGALYFFVSVGGQAMQQMPAFFGYLRSCSGVLLFGGIVLQLINYINFWKAK